MKKINYRIKLALALFALALCAVALVIGSRQLGVGADIIAKPSATTNLLPSISYDQSDFFLTIDAVSVKAPIIPDVDGADKEVYFSSLQKGVAHMSGTAKPDKEGNVVIFGHSNFYESDPGAYKQIFKNLDDLETGDKIIVHYQGKDYNYSVVKQQLVVPEDTWVISAPYDLTLITCWPPGTTEKRLIVFANLEIK